MCPCSFTFVISSLGAQRKLVCGSWPWGCAGEQCRITSHRVRGIRLLWGTGQQSLGALCAGEGLEDSRHWPGVSRVHCQWLRSPEVSLLALAMAYSMHTSHHLPCLVMRTSWWWLQVSPE